VLDDDGYLTITDRNSDEVAWAILLLVSDAASFITGQTFAVDGRPNVEGND